MALFRIAPMLALLLAASPLAAQAPKTILEAWDAAYLQGQNSPTPAHAGHSLTRVVETEENGKKVYQASVHLRLAVKRFNSVIRIDMDTGDVESPDGKITRVFMRQFLGKDQTNVITGVVDGKVLKLMQNEKNPLEPAPWDDSAIGTFKQRMLFQDRAIKAGDTFTFRSFEPVINLVVTQHVKAIGEEEVEMFAGKFKKKALRVEVQPEKVQGVALPKQVMWLDETLLPIRSESELPFGKIILYKATKEVATGDVAPNLDIGTTQYVMLKQKIARPYQTKQAAFRVKFPEDQDDIASIFAKDSRQKTKAEGGKAVELRISAVGVEPRSDENREEYLKGSYFIACDDGSVRKHAESAVGDEKDAWKKALRMEKYVKEKMRVSNFEALATADHVARTLQGDCTEHAMLLAAMCRSQGIPSRTAVGLVYADLDKGPALAFHMWTEVFHDGKWWPLDATLGQGYVGATHIKISDQSWAGERTMTPLLPVFRVLGKIAVDVLETSN